MTREAFQAVLAQIPTRTRFGIGLLADGRPRTPAARTQAFATEQAALLDDAETFTRVCAWLAPMRKRKTVNPRYSSYGLKHLAEAALGGYVANGVFIAAAVHCGFTPARIPGSPNVRFNIAEGDLHAARRRQDASR